MYRHCDTDVCAKYSCKLMRHFTVKATNVIVALAGNA